MEGNKTALGLDEKLEGALCYVLGWVTGLIFLLLEKDNKFVRFHAMQSMAVFLGLFVVSWVLWMIPIIGWTIAGLLSVASFILWLVLMIKAYQGEKFKLPVVGDFAEQQISK
jgi:uncharacterized membrane protein